MAEPVDQVDTSVGPEDDTDTSADLEDSDVSWDDGDEVQSDVEDSADEAATDSEEDTTEAEDTDVQEDDEESSDSDQQPQEDRTDSAKEDEERKRHNAEMAQRRIQEREARRAKQQEDQQAYLEQADDATDQALRQLQVDAYNNRVMMLTNQVQSDVISVRDSVPEFSSDNPLIRESMLKALDDFEAYHIKKDEYGNITGVDGDVRSFINARADEIRQLTSIGKQEQAKAKETQKKRTTPTPTRAPKVAKNDDMGFEDYLNQY